MAAKEVLIRKGYKLEEITLNTVLLDATTKFLLLRDDFELQRTRFFQIDSEENRSLLDALDDPTDPHVVEWTDLPEPRLLLSGMRMTNEILRPTLDASSEDCIIDDIVYGALMQNFSPDGSLKQTTTASRLTDRTGREQRAGISFFISSGTEWTDLVTFLDGHGDIESPLLVDQCKNRADIILDMQPWRRVVVIPMYSRSEVRFLRVSRVGVTRLQHIELSKPQQMFTFRSNDEQELVGVDDGFHQLLFFLLYPVHLGYLPCSVTMSGLQGYPTATVNATVICARSGGKAVFALRDCDNTVWGVCKAFADGAIAEYERVALQSLQRVSGIPRLLSDAVLSCTVQEQIEGPAATWSALVMTPYCTALTAFTAWPAHFEQFANILKEASEGVDGVNHNDISPDSLMLYGSSVDAGQKIPVYDDSAVAVAVMASAAAAAYIVNWGSATRRGTMLDARTEKHSFLPLNCIDRKTGRVGERTSSLLNDLYSLYLVAVCCCKGDVPWAGIDQRRHHSVCSRYCGLGLRGFSRDTRLPGQWRYLELVAEELRQPEPQVDKIVDSFRGWRTYMI
jgi:hypothetical protein